MCSEYALHDNGVDYDVFSCIRCAKGYINVKGDCIALYNLNTGVRENAINLNTGTKVDYPGYASICIAAVPEGTYFRCVYGATPENLALFPASEDLVYTDTSNLDQKCLDFDWATFTCKSENDCFYENTVTYNKQTKACSTRARTCNANCRVSDGNGACAQCDDSFNLVNGRCVNYQVAGC